MDSRFLDVNAHGVLRIPGPLWLGFALLCRYWILLVLVAFVGRRDATVGVMLGDGGVNWLLAALEIPAVVLAVAAGRRVPEAGAVPRLLWRHGRTLMILAAAANLVWTGRLLWQVDDWNPWPELFLASCCLLDLAIVVAACTSPYLKQLFLEFPSKPAEGAKS